MATVKKRVSFFDSEEGTMVKDALDQMAKDSMYNTSDSYSANIVQNPDNLISFTNKHMNYLNSHPKIDPNQYIANLRLMTKIK
jgi:hypothetical protein